jgi:pimeloyl-ACP methyl ester carboxylesterase
MARWHRLVPMPKYRGPREFPFATRHVDTPSGRLAFFDEGSGPPLLFVHGLGGDFTHFEHVAAALADRHRVIGVDMPGCGDSEKPRHRLSMAAYGRAILDVMDTLALDRATLLGHSAGGLAVSSAAPLAPARVERLVLINTAGLRRFPAALRLAARVFVRRPLIDIMLALTAHRILEHVFASENEFTRKFVEDQIHRAHPGRLPHVSKVMQDLLPDVMRSTVWKNAHLLAAPALIIWGDRDRLMPLAAVRRSAARLPAGRLEVLSGCGHMPIIEQPGAVVELVRSFLRGDRAHLEAVP